MTCPYDNQLELVRQLRDLGATEIEVDGLRVVFPAPGPVYTLAAPEETPKSPLDLQAELDRLNKAHEEEFEDILFHSSQTGGVS